MNCIISLETGFSERKPSKRILTVLRKSKRVLESVTNINPNHERAKARLRTKSKRAPYFRFNPSTAKDEISLADFKMLHALEKYTRTYLNSEQIKVEIKQCAELLYHR